MEQAFWLSAVGAFLALDNVMVGQWMIAQPLITGGIFGWLLGDIPGGLLVGAMVQLIWIGILPVGAYVPSDHTITGGITAGLACTLSHHQGLNLGPSMILALAAAIPAGFISGKLDILVRHVNSRIAGMGELAAERWGTAGVDGLNLLGLVGSWLRNFIIFFIWFGPLAVPLAWLPGHLPVPVLRGLSAVFWVLPMLGLAVILEIVAKEKSLWLMAGTFGLGLVLLLLGPQHGLLIFGGLLVLGMVFVGWKRTW